MARSDCKSAKKFHICSLGSPKRQKVIILFVDSYLVCLVSTFDYYALLELSRSASMEDIKRAFRLKARTCHPDVAGADSLAAERFHRLHEAYEVLLDPQSRARYDALKAVEAAVAQVRMRRATRTTRFMRPEVPLERKRGLTPPVLMRPVSASFVLSLEEALHGTRREFLVERWTEGKVLKRERLKVSIPPGMPSEKPVCLDGIGEDGKKRPVHLSLKLEPHPDYECDGEDLLVNLALYPWEFVLGGKQRCTLFKETVYVQIPSGSQPGARLRLKGLGLPTKMGGRGDLWVVLSLRLPKAQTEAQVAAWQALSKLY